MREKLIELMTDNLPRIGDLPKCDNPLQYTMDEIVGRLADHLIANGVTFAKDNNVPSKWIPVTERLPKEDGKYLVNKNLYGTPYIAAIRFAKIGEKVCAYDLMGQKNVWYDYDSETGYFPVTTVTHWMPLPEPPKGE